VVLGGWMWGRVVADFLFVAVEVFVAWRVKVAGWSILLLGWDNSRWGCVVVILVGIMMVK